MPELVSAQSEAPQQQQRPGVHNLGEFDPSVIHRVI